MAPQDTRSLDSTEVSIDSSSLGHRVIANRNFQAADRITGIAQPQGSFCTCSNWVTARCYRRSRSWGYFVFNEEGRSEQSHLPDCPLFEVIPPKATRTFSLIYTGISKIISTAIEISLSSRQQGGIRSISPSLRYYHMVDQNLSPAFSLTKILRLYLYDLPFSPPESTVILSYISRIYNVYLSRKSHATDYVDTGETVLHVVLQALSNARLPIVRLLERNSYSYRRANLWCGAGFKGTQPIRYRGTVYNDSRHQLRCPSRCRPL